MKSYHDQKYPAARRVMVKVTGFPPWVDGIKGLNTGHALWRARWNWDGATVVDLGPESP